MALAADKPMVQDRKLVNGAEDSEAAEAVGEAVVVIEAVIEVASGKARVAKRSLSIHPLSSNCSLHCTG